MKIGSIDLGERPVFLAPMEDVTDISFRVMYGKTLRGGHGIYGVRIKRRVDPQCEQNTAKTKCLR